jgi:tripartite-type tricarboxylate transporter receptor subunit TctC
MRRTGLALLACLCGDLAAAEPLSLQGKSVNVIVPYAAGGGTDAAGRMMAEHFARFLPGGPSVIVRNMPGADGMVGMNYFVQKVPPDGLAIAIGNGTSSDPLQYRKPQSHYDPRKFRFVGGISRGGYFLLINKAAEPRLHDRRSAPVAMGTIGAVPRAAMGGTVWGIEVLGWNARWVPGYAGTNELLLALERGEIDMTATGVPGQVRRLLDSGKFTILAGFDSGGVVRTEFGDVPIFAKIMRSKIKDPTMIKAFDYYLGMMAVDKWVALPPATPEPIVARYREAFARMSKDAEFLKRGRMMSEEFVPTAHGEVEQLVSKLGDTPPDALRFINALYKKQGLLSE